MVQWLKFCEYLRACFLTSFEIAACQLKHFTKDQAFENCYRLSRDLIAVFCFRFWFIYLIPSFDKQSAPVHFVSAIDLALSSATLIARALSHSHANLWVGDSVTLNGVGPEPFACMIDFARAWWTLHFYCNDLRAKAKVCVILREVGTLLVCDVPRIELCIWK